MFVRIEKGSSVPISRQLLEQIRSQILAGKLSAETRLPSVRELARQIGVNANTIVRVYERLAGQDLIEMRHGDGTYVLAQTRQDAPLRQQREKLREELRLLIRQAHMLGMSRTELRKLVDEAMSRTAKEIKESSAKS